MNNSAFYVIMAQINSLEEQGLSPYQILGVTPETSLGEINATYRGLVMICHPDKSNTTESRRLGLTDSEKAIMFETVQKAYKEIVGQKKETNAPDYDIRYAIDSDVTVSQNDLIEIENRRRVHREMLSNISGDIHEVVNSTRTELLFFNKEFEKELEKNTDDTSNPFSRGYADKFDTYERKEDHDYIKRNKDRMPVEFGYELPLEKEMFEDSISIHMSGFYQTNKNFCNIKNEIGHMELGLTTETLTNFTVEGNVTDLEEALENKEYFETAFKRNFACINNSRAARTLDDIVKERESEILDSVIPINNANQPEFQKIKEKMGREKEIIDAKETIRQKVIKKENDALRLIEGIKIPVDEEE